MNKVILQFWEESERGWGIRPDGCSIHISETNRENFVKSIYSLRNESDDVPDIYERINGEQVIAFIEDGLFKELKEQGSLRLLEHELNNLIKLEEIIFKP
jgi:hypothetical protein